MMVDFPKKLILKDIPVDSVYYIPLGPGNVKLEPLVRGQRFGESQAIGWRIIINLNIIASRDKGGIYQLPIKKRIGKVTSFYELFLDKRKWEEVSNQGQKQYQHPDLLLLIKFVYSNFDSQKYLLSLEEVRDLRREEFDKKIEFRKKDLDFSILYSKELENISSPQKNDIKYLNPEETDLLSLEDISNIIFNIPKISQSVKNQINDLLNNMCLDQDFLNHERHSTRELLEIHSCIRNYLYGEQPQFSGMVLFGQPGTGKTHLIQESLMKIYSLLGFNTHFQEIGDMLSNQYVGGLATNVTNKIFGPAIQKIKSNHKPCFVYIDEATDLLRKDKGNSRDSGWRSQGVEAMKSFINRSRYPGIIVCLATNLEAKNFDDALTRSGRLQKLLIDLPNEERCKQIWEYANEKLLFPTDELKKFKFSNEQLKRLAIICADKINVATITEVSKNYRGINRDWDGNSEQFIVDLVSESKRYLLEEYNKSKEDIQKYDMAFMPEKEKEKTLQKLEKKYQEQLYSINKAMDPNLTSSSKNFLLKFGNILKKRNNVEFFYRDFLEMLNNWKKYIQPNPNKLYDKESIKLIGRILSKLKLCLEYRNTQIKLIENELINIKNNFLIIVKASRAEEKEFIYLKDSDLIEFFDLIENLPSKEKLFEGLKEDDFTPKLYLGPFDK